MVNLSAGLPFTVNSAPAGVRRPAVSLTVGSGGPGGLGAGLAGNLLTLEDDFWASHWLSLRLDLGVAPFVDCLRVDYVSGGDTPEINLGDTLSLGLGYGDSGQSDVFQGTITRHHHGLAGQSSLYASGAGFSLSHLRLNQRYEQQTAGDIASDLASQASVSTAMVESGISLPFYGLLSHTPAYGHIAQLARRCGYWAYIDPAGKLVFATAQLGQAVQTFTYGADILTIDLRETVPSVDAAVVAGEGAAGTQGQAAANWLAEEGVRSQTGNGSHTRHISDGALRNQAAIQSVASSAVTSPVLTGSVWVAGTPAVTVGSTVTLLQLPQDSLNGDFLVRQVCHRLDKTRGFITQLQVVKPGDAGLLSGALGSLGGLL